jgi:hypothetical protein
MNRFSGWRGQLRAADERAPLRLRAPNPAAVGRQATAEIVCVPQQTVGGPAFEVIPDLLRRIELRGIRRELFQMQAGVGLAHGLDGRSPGNLAAIPAQDDGSAEMPQECAEEGGDLDGLEVTRLNVDVEAHMLTLWRHGERRQRREPVMLVVVRDDGRVPRWRPGATAGGHEQKATLIQEDEVGPKSSGFFVSPATCSASNAR